VVKEEIEEYVKPAGEGILTNQPRSLLLSALFFMAISSVSAETVPSVVSNLLIQPDNSIADIKSRLQAATKTIDMTIYDLLDPDVEQTLIDMAAKNVVVRVILDHNREGQDNQAAYDFLNAHNVAARWAPPRFAATHAKCITIDGVASIIMTNNLDTRYYPTGRDFSIVDTDPLDNAVIEQVFAGDFTGQPITPSGAPNLTWSPTQSETAILNLINSAQRTLDIENEEMALDGIVDALVQAVKRGVAVHVIMTLSKDWEKNFELLSRGGVQVAVYEPNAPLYIHAKVILMDYATGAQKLFLGSQNFSYDSLDKNRELGLTIVDPDVIAKLAGTLAKDFTGGRIWQINPPTSIDNSNSSDVSK
jgi:phosphatidylserine/phosphatidylglycerophosphate/cardiolipin synthase-like enzyme